jgi:hypothetical protein
MKTIIRLIALACLACAVPLVTTSCQTAPSERVLTIQTLKSVGQTAEAAVTLSAQLYRDSKITAAQARQVMDLYDGKFQPAFRFAVVGARSNLESVASPDLLNLASQLAALVASFQKP